MDEPDEPLFTISEVGDALIENPAELDVTVRVTVVVCVMPPPVPVTVIGYEPTAVLAPTVIDMAELPVPVIDDGLKPTVTPLGCPVAVKLTAELNPPLTVLVIVELPAWPCTTVTEVGDAERLKLGVEPVPTSAPINAGVGLPHPVTRS